MTSTSEKPKFYVKEEHHPENATSLGFWIYLMGDCLIFAVLFATYGVIGRNYAAGPSPSDLFDLSLVAINTGLLLVSSITFGVAMLQAERNAKSAALVWLSVTGLLGLAFIGVEMFEFVKLIEEGATPQRSGFLSAFFVLVGTHALHVMFGIIWLVTLMVQINRHGLIPENRRRLSCLSMFWHFLDVIWIGVFSVVYLMGALI